MDSGKGALVVVPAWNEAESISVVIHDIQKTLPKATILVVDDGSTDQTAQIARGLGVRVASLPFNLGVGGALRLGFKIARAEGFQSVVQTDADGQHLARFIPALLKGLQSADVVIGSRFHDDSAYEVGWARGAAMRLLSTLLSRVARVKLNDTTSGFKAYGPAAISVFAEQIPAEYLGDTVEAIVIGTKSRLRFAEVSVTMNERIAGTPSQSSFSAAKHLIRALIAVTFALLREPRKAVSL